MLLDIEKQQAIPGRLDGTRRCEQREPDTRSSREHPWIVLPAARAVRGKPGDAVTAPRREPALDPRDRRRAQLVAPGRVVQAHRDVSEPERAVAKAAVDDARIDRIAAR